MSQMYLPVVSTLMSQKFRLKVIKEIRDNCLFVLCFHSKVRWVYLYSTFQVFGGY